MIDAYNAALTLPGSPTPLILDAIRFAETGHLTPEKARTARSSAGAIGPYQLMESNLHQMGYGVQPNRTVQDARDPDISRQIAKNYITGFNKQHNFKNLAHTLIAYNRGPAKADEWLASGGRYEDLPEETKQYIDRATRYVENNSMNNNYQSLYQPRNVVAPRNDLNSVPVPGYNPALDNAQVNVMPQSSSMGDVPVPNYNPAVNGAQVDITSFNTPTDFYDIPSAPALAAFYDIPSAPALAVAAEPQTNNNTNTVGSLTTGNRFRTALSPSAPTKQPVQTTFQPMDINEMLIRIGSAGLNQVGSGGNAMMAAAGSEYGNLMDQRRSDALDAYKASLSAKPKAAEDNSERIAKVDQSIAEFNQAIELLNRGNLTGPIEGTIMSLYDSFVGNPEAASRLLLRKLRVDDGLLRLAQTKGAISNYEMELFLSPAPDFYEDESVWIDWANRRIRDLQTVKRRLNDGVVLDPSEAATKSQIDQLNSQILLSNGVTVKAVNQ